MVHINLHQNRLFGHAMMTLTLPDEDFKLTNFDVSFSLLFSSMSRLIETVSFCFTRGQLDLSITFFS